MHFFKIFTLSCSLASAALSSSTYTKLQAEEIEDMRRTLGRCSSEGLSGTVGYAIEKATNADNKHILEFLVGCIESCQWGGVKSSIIKAIQDATWWANLDGLGILLSIEGLVWKDALTGITGGLGMANYKHFDAVHEYIKNRTYLSPGAHMDIYPHAFKYACDMEDAPLFRALFELPDAAWAHMKEPVIKQIWKEYLQVDLRFTPILFTAPQFTCEGSEALFEKMISNFINRRKVKDLRILITAPHLPKHVMNSAIQCSIRYFTSDPGDQEILSIFKDIVTDGPTFHLILSIQIMDVCARNAPSELQELISSPGFVFTDYKRMMNNLLTSACEKDQYGIAKVILTGRVWEDVRDGVIKGFTAMCKIGNKDMLSLVLGLSGINWQDGIMSFISGLRTAVESNKAWLVDMIVGIPGIQWSDVRKVAPDAIELSCRKLNPGTLSRILSIPGLQWQDIHNAVADSIEYLDSSDGIPMLRELYLIPGINWENIKYNVSREIEGPHSVEFMRVLMTCPVLKWSDIADSVNIAFSRAFNSQDFEMVHALFGIGANDTDLVHSALMTMMREDSCRAVEYIISKCSSLPPLGKMIGWGSDDCCLLAILKAARIEDIRELHRTLKPGTSKKELISKYLETP